MAKTTVNIGKKLLRNVVEETITELERHINKHKGLPCTYSKKVSILKENIDEIHGSKRQYDRYKNIKNHLKCY